MKQMEAHVMSSRSQYKAKFFIILMAILIIANSGNSNAQLPDFMNRLSGGRVTNKNFKEVVDFTLVDNRICLKARINDYDRELSFILDTYAICLIREGLLNKLNLDILDCTRELGEKFENTIMRPLFPKYHKISIGSVVFKDIGSMVMKETRENPLLYVLEDGLIGANLMKSCIWQIDFMENKIIITDRIDKFDNLEDTIQFPFKPMPLQGSPNIQVVLNGKDTVDVQFDTGGTSFLSFLSPALKSEVDSGRAVAWHAKLAIPVNKEESTGIETHYFVKLKTLEIGSKTFKDIPIAVYNPSNENLMNKGSIGIEFLKNFIVTLDWLENKIYLAPIEGRHLKQNIRTFGFSYGYEDGAIRVKSIYEGSEAEKSRIKIGDRIFSINGQDIKDLSDTQVKNLRYGDLEFSKEEDENITIEVLIGDQRKKIKLKAYNLFF
jgi:predicted aspartyl protease